MTLVKILKFRQGLAYLSRYGHDRVWVPVPGVGYLNCIRKCVRIVQSAQNLRLMT